MQNPEGGKKGEEKTQKARGLQGPEQWTGRVPCAGEGSPSRVPWAEAPAGGGLSFLRDGSVARLGEYKGTSGDKR